MAVHPPPRRRRRGPLVAFAALLCLGVATPAFAAGIPDGDGAAPAREPSVVDLKLSHAWVAAGPLEFGAEPLAHVQEAAAAAAGGAACDISAAQATALTLAPTWPEVSPSGEPPSPMTLSRYDTQPTLGDPQARAPGLWFHPGIGMWQLDSAGLGTDFTAAEAMNSHNAAGRMAPFMVGKYCTSRNNGASEAAARVEAWRDWVACRSGACEDTYQRALAGVTPIDGVGPYGGGEVRQCDYAGTQHECLFVDPAKAQGANWWAAPGGGRSPVAAPFYVLRLDTAAATTELRYWLSEDSGAGTDVAASRAFGTNAREGLVWTAEDGLCDRTAGRGNCAA